MSVVVVFLIEAVVCSRRTSGKLLFDTCFESQGRDQGNTQQTREEQVCVNLKFLKCTLFMSVEHLSRNVHAPASIFLIENGRSLVRANPIIIIISFLLVFLLKNLDVNSLRIVNRWVYFLENLILC